MDDENKITNEKLIGTEASGAPDERCPSEKEDVITAYSQISIPYVPLKGLVVFPGMSVNFDVGKGKSLSAVEEAVKNDSLVFLVPQKISAIPNPSIADLHGVGVVARVKQVVRIQPSDTAKVLVQGVYRANLIGEDISSLNVPRVFVRRLTENAVDGHVFEAYKRKIFEMLRNFVRSDSKFNGEIINLVLSINSTEGLIGAVAGAVVCSEKDRVALLTELDNTYRLDRLLRILADELEIARINKIIEAKVKTSIEKNQREFYLREQMKAISEELGDGENEVVEYTEKIKSLGMPPELEKKALKEISRLIKMPSSSPDAATIRTYADWICDLPWNVLSEDNINIAEAKRILESDHFGLEKVKQRIIEYLAVIHLTKDLKSPILCFVGPPGVGKTSIAQSIARAVNRKYVRMSLGGVRDEAEIRGHRRTYIGSIPGQILYNIKAAGTRNPVFLLDEIDKMSSDFRGDPASAMLEVLDPEQNHSFKDHYLEMPFDLSKVMFICTANSVDGIPSPLLDRMEIIEINGYTQDEKVEIAKQFLIRKQEKANGLENGSVVMSDDILRMIISDYTRESGVRKLEREISAIARKTALRIVESNGEFAPLPITSADVSEYLGTAVYRNDEERNDDEIGACTGLAWTSFGGTTLTIEVSLAKGKGDIQLTGKLGDVMKESARIALSLIRSRASEYGIDDSVFSEHDISVHVPEGAVPKDGPSAGITIATAILSALSKKPVNHEIAMTGEITLRGKVLPIGGLKEKALAAERVGIKKLIIPFGNQRDIRDLPENVRNDLEFIPVNTIDEVFAASILR